MKHIITTSSESTQKIIKEIVEKTHSEFNTSDQQLTAMIHPIVANNLFDEVNKIIENERFETIIKLARVLNDEQMHNALVGLNYSLTINK